VSLMKLMPLAALSVAGAVGVSGMKDSANVVDKFQVAAIQNVELNGIAQAVAQDYTESNRLPIDNFADFLRSNMRTASGKPPDRDPAIDPWETPYKLEQIHNGFQVLCAGPDKTWDTDDDLIHPFDLSGISDTPPQGTPDGNGAAASQQSNVRPKAQQPTRAANQPRRARTSDKETEQRVIAFQKRQADKGSARAQLALAERHLFGEGVKYDPQLGMEWLRKAADNGSQKAKDKLSTMGKAEGKVF
jgi:TPR repeat protein